MRNLFLLLFLIPLVASSQQKRDEFYELIKYKDSVLFPDSTVWYNSDRAFNTIDVFKKVTIVHFWDPNASDQDQALQEVLKLQADHQEVFLITVLKSDAVQTLSADNVNQLLQANGIYHPVAVFDDFEPLKPYEFDSYGSYVALLDYGSLFMSQSILEPKRTLPAAIDSLIKRVPKDIISKRITGFESYKVGVRTRNILDSTGAMAFDAKNGKLFVVDEFKNLIVVLDIDGRVIETIGNGTHGDRDGKFSASHFNQIGGIAFDEDKNLLYISDALNNKLKVADFETGRVETILGSGGESLISGQDINRTSGSIDQPGSLSYRRGSLWIAMDGDHQLYEYNTLTGIAKHRAGSGNRMLKLGDANSCSFLSMNEIHALDESKVLILDESNQQMLEFNVDSNMLTSSVSFDEMKKDKWINNFTLVDDAYYYTDALNNCIWKQEGSGVELFSGLSDAQHGYKDGKKSKARYWNPSAIIQMNKELLVADAFNGLLRTVSLKKSKSNTLKIYDYKNLFMYADPFGDKDILYHEEVNLKSEAINNLIIDLELPVGYSWDRSGRNEVRLTNMDGKELINGDPTKGYIEIDIESNEFFPNVIVQMYLTVKDPNGRVQFQSLVLNVPFVFSNSSSSTANTQFVPFQ